MMRRKKEEQEKEEETDQWVLYAIYVELCELGLFKERKIKHYSSLQRILLVGEGDFSFSACLATAFGSASNIVATSLDSSDFLCKNYGKATSNISELRSRGSKVMHGVDATDMANNCALKGLIFDRIIFNFPLAGFFPDQSRETQLRRNRKLILKFLKNAKKLVSEYGEIHITNKSVGFFLEWDLGFLGLQAGLRLVEEVDFNFKSYNGYRTKYGFGGDKNFNCNPSKTYKFSQPLLSLHGTMSGGWDSLSSSVTSPFWEWDCMNPHFPVNGWGETLCTPSSPPSLSLSSSVNGCWWE